MYFEPGKEVREFNCLYKEVERLYYNVAANAGISVSSFFIFYTIAELGDGCLQKDICEMYSISKQTIHSAIKKMEKEGYLYLKEGKGRNRNIYLTTKGKDFIQHEIIPVVQAEEAVFASMTFQESRTLLYLTRKYAILLQQKMEEVFKQEGKK